MKTYLVWVLMSMSQSGHSGYAIQYSPPLETRADCDKLLVIAKRPSYVTAECVQVSMVVMK
jgi:hypothetical protein